MGSETLLVVRILQRYINEYDPTTGKETYKKELPVEPIKHPVSREQIATKILEQDAFYQARLKAMGRFKVGDKVQLTIGPAKMQQAIGTIIAVNQFKDGGTVRFDEKDIEKVLRFESIRQGYNLFYHYWCELKSSKVQHDQPKSKK